MAKVANTDAFKNFPGWNPIEKHKNYGQNQKASNMEPFGGNLWHCAGQKYCTWSTPPMIGSTHPSFMKIYDFAIWTFDCGVEIRSVKCI